MRTLLLRALLVAAVAEIEVLAVRASAAEISHAQLRALAVDAARDGDVAFSPPWEKTVGRMLWVKDAGPAADDPAGLTLTRTDGNIALPVPAVSDQASVPDYLRDRAR